MTKLFYQGHGSFYLESNDGNIIYVDPYAGNHYEKEADFVLITHEHGDHNKLELVRQKPNCVVLRSKDFINEDGSYNEFKYQDISFLAMQAYNNHHKIEECIGCIITIDGIQVYVAGDTSMTKDMETMAKMNLDYVMLPTDGIYNMNVIEASECANLINGKHSIPIHMKPGELFCEEVANAFNGMNKLIIKVNEEILL